MQLKNLHSRVGLLKIQNYYKHIPFLILLGVVVLYCLLPVTLNDYTWIPGDDYTEYLIHLREFPKPIRYYGALPAKILPFDDLSSLRIYYYLTPLFVFLGLYSFLRHYGLWVVTLAFVTLFFITSVILQDMEAGSFVGIIGFYSLFLPSLYFICERKLPRLTVGTLLFISVLFHTGVGVLLLLGYLIARVRNIRDFIPLLLPSILAIILVVTLGGSLTQSTQLLYGPDTTYAPPVTFIYFTKKFLGVTTLTLLGLIFLFCYNTSKFYAFKDRYIITLLIIACILIVFAFSAYFPVISYRLSLFAVGSLVIAFLVAFTRAYRRVISLNLGARKYINLGVLLAFGVLLYNTFSDLLTYWLSMGSYTTP